MTKVKFLLEKVGGGVFAYFPELKADTSGNMTSYSHIGQHSGCSHDYARSCRVAVYSQYNRLLIELVGQGYKDLEVINAELMECWRSPTKREISFGEGVKHYNYFTIREIGINKKGNLKKWFISKDDGLRYNRY